MLNTKLSLIALAIVSQSCFTFAQEQNKDVIEKEYGSVEGYLKREVGLTDKNILRLREMYTT